MTVLLVSDRPEVSPFVHGVYYAFVAFLFLLYASLDWFVEGEKYAHLFWIWLGLYFFARSLSFFHRPPNWME